MIQTFTTILAWADVEYEEYDRPLTLLQEVYVLIMYRQILSSHAIMTNYARHSISLDK